MIGIRELRIPKLKEKGWLLVIVLLWAAISLHDDVEALIDRHGGEPFVTAELSVLRINDEYAIDYKIDARLLAGGTWTATVETADGQRLDSRKGSGNYSPERRGGVWSWGEFFTDPFASSPLPAPAIPDQPFRVCVFYELTALRSMTTRGTPEYCSEVFTP